MTIKKGEKHTLTTIKKGKKNTLKQKENYREIHPDCLSALARIFHI